MQLVQWRSQDFEVEGNMASAEREPIYEGLGAEPRGVQRQNPW
jgi:hypothetical protein